jgi:hypothetical protein
MSREIAQGSCKKCPKLMIANKNRTECILYNGYEYYDAILIYTRLFEKHISSLVGPIKSENTKYYLSPLKAQKLIDAIDDDFEDVAPHEECYAFALIKKAELNNELGIQRTFRVKQCIANKIESIEIGDDSLTDITIVYSSKSKCPTNSNISYTATLHIICDPSKNEHNPPVLLDSESSCDIEFEWEMPHICRICNNEDISKNIGQCINGSRKVSKEIRKGSTCQIPNKEINDLIYKIKITDLSSKENFNSSNATQYVFYSTESEVCEEYEVKGKYITVAIILSAVILAALLIAIMCAKKYKSQYMDITKKTFAKGECDTFLGSEGERAAYLLHWKDWQHYGLYQREEVMIRIPSNTTIYCLYYIITHMCRWWGKQFE